MRILSRFDRATILPLIFLLLVAVTATVLPYGIARIQAGEEWRGVTPQLSEDAMRYFARANDVMRGNIYPHNPYFIEHRDDPSPTPSINDAIVALPQFLGLTFNQAYYANIFFWAMLFLLLTFVFFRQLGMSHWWSVFGAVWAYAGVYGDMLRPGAMQIVFPYFLLFLVTLYRFMNRTASWLPLALVLGLGAYSYIYLPMVMFATLGVAAMATIIRRDHAEFRRIAIVGIAGLILSVPHFLNVYLLSAHEFYRETLIRIVLAPTHWPQVEAYYYGRWFILALLLIFLIRRFRPQNFSRETSLFLGCLGAGIFIAMFTNVVTGQDFDIAVHVARFGILWYILTGVIIAPVAWNYLVRERSEGIWRVGITILFLFLVAQMIQNLSRTTTPLWLNPELTKHVQTFSGVISWLHTVPPSVIHAPGQLNGYITVLTNHYVLFDRNGGLFLLSNEEMRERYLLAHAFDELTQEEFLARRPEYDGPTPDVLAKASRLQHFLCTGFWFDSACPSELPESAFVPEKEIASIYDRYYSGLQDRITKEYFRYHVKYVIFDRRDQAHDKQYAQCEIVYEDEWFTVCSGS